MTAVNETNVSAVAPNLDVLAERLQDAKRNLEAARREVFEAEGAILDAVGAKLEGSQTVAGDRFKITTTGKVNRSIDADEAKRLYLDGLIPEAIYNRLFSWEPKLDLRELRFVELNEPDNFRAISRAVVSKPGKTTVTVKAI